MDDGASASEPDRVERSSAVPEHVLALGPAARDAPEHVLALGPAAGDAPEHVLALGPAARDAPEDTSALQAEIACLRAEIAALRGAEDGARGRPEGPTRSERSPDLVAALRDADRHKDEFLAALSHELRNPLAPIRNSLYILEHTAGGGEQ